jgi:hypothetical protein
MKHRTNVSLDADLLARFKKLVPSVSAEFNEFMRRRVAELEGRPEDFSGDYGELKKKHSTLYSRVSRKEVDLREGAPEAFAKANESLAQLGMKADLSNADQIIPKLVGAWTGEQDFLHEYISLVELSREKRKVEHRLSEMRTSNQEPEVKPCTDIVPLPKQ